MKTRIRHLSEMEVLKGLPRSVMKPIKPEQFADRQTTRLSKTLGLSQFDVNHVTLAPNSYSSLRHWHQGEDEFVYVLSGILTLIDDNGEHELIEGSFTAFPAGISNAHHLTNKSAQAATYLVVGANKPGEDICFYPDDDLDPVKR